MTGHEDTNADSGGQTTPTMLLCVATEKGLAVLQEAVQQDSPWNFAVCTFRQPEMARCFSQDILTLAEAHNCQMVELGDFRGSPQTVVRRHGITRILCAGWKYLIPDEVVSDLNGDVFIAHDSLLPKYRGFAPLPTAMINGESQTGVSFIRAGQSVDSGDIIWQGAVRIESSDSVATVIKKLLPLYRTGARCLLTECPVEGTPQNDADATYSIWRDEQDYNIDWHLDAHTIERTIRALGSPYPGACAILNGKPVRLRKATVLADLKFARRQPGKIWSLDHDGRPHIVCGKGLLRLDEADSDGVSILPMQSLRLRFE